MRVNITKSDKPEKRMMAIFTQDNGRTKTIYFGSSEGKAFVDHKDEQVKSAWLARHKVRGTFEKPMSASALARWVLWNKPSLKDSIIDFKKRFNYI